MDKETVRSTLENELDKLRLTERGHIKCLKNFCMPSAATTDTDIKKELVAAVKQARLGWLKKKKKKKSATLSSIKERTRLEKKTASLGWINYDKKKNDFDFVTIHESTGGGTRTVAFPNNANGNMKMIYFQHIRNCLSQRHL